MDFSISGEVKRENNTPAGRIEVYLYSVTSPNVPLQVAETATLSGAYQFTGIAAGQYVVRPQDNRFAFDPPNQLVELTDANATEVNFIAIELGVMAGGRIEDAEGTGVPEVLVGLFTDNSSTPLSTTYSNQNGAYLFTNLEPGNYKVEPTSSVYTFTPLDHSFTITTTNILTLNFLVDTTVPTFTLRGTVLQGMNGLRNVRVTLSRSEVEPPIASVVTNDEGDYVFTNIPSGTYKVTPSRFGYTFTPPSITVQVLANTKVAVFQAESTGNGNLVLFLPIVRRR